MAFGWPTEAPSASRNMGCGSEYCAELLCLPGDEPHVTCTAIMHVHLWTGGLPCIEDPPRESRN
jgi:hypothetical protein